MDLPDCHPARSFEPKIVRKHQTNASCLGDKAFREHITGYSNFQNGVVWGDNDVKGTCAAVLGNNWNGTSGFAQAQCSGTIGAPNSVSFWADWGAGDGAVMMIGSGGNNCARADHGIGHDRGEQRELYLRH